MACCKTSKAPAAQGTPRSDTAGFTQSPPDGGYAWDVSRVSEAEGKAVSVTKACPVSDPTYKGARVNGRVMVEFTLSALDARRIADEVQYTITASHDSMQQGLSVSRPMCSSGATRALLRSVEENATSTPSPASLSSSPAANPTARVASSSSSSAQEAVPQRLKHHTVRFSADFCLPDVAQDSKILLLLTRTGDVGVGRGDSHRAVVLSRSVHLLDTHQRAPMAKEGWKGANATPPSLLSHRTSTPPPSQCTSSQEPCPVVATHFTCSRADDGRAFSRSSTTGSMAVHSSFSSMLAMVDCERAEEEQTSSSEATDGVPEDEEMEGMEMDEDEDEEETGYESDGEGDEMAVLEAEDGEEAEMPMPRVGRWRRDSAVCSLSIEYVNHEGVVVRTKADVPAQTELHG